jgi:hypothetical protein
MVIDTKKGSRWLRCALLLIYIKLNAPRLWSLRCSSDCNLGQPVSQQTAISVKIFIVNASSSICRCHWQLVRWANLKALHLLTQLIRPTIHMALLASNRTGLRYFLKHAELHFAKAAGSCLSVAQEDAVAAVNKEKIRGSLEVEKGLSSDKLPLWAAAGTVNSSRDKITYAVMEFGVNFNVACRRNCCTCTRSERRIHRGRKGDTPRIAVKPKNPLWIGSSILINWQTEEWKLLRLIITVGRVESILDWLHPDQEYVNLRPDFWWLDAVISLKVTITSRF